MYSTATAKSQFYGSSSCLDRDAAEASKPKAAGEEMRVPRARGYISKRETCRRSSTCTIADG